MSSYYRVFRTSKLSDQQVLNFVAEISEKFEVKHSKFEAIIGIDLKPEDVERIRAAQDSSFIFAQAKIDIGINAYSIHYVRGVCANERQPFHERIPSPYFDEFVLQVPSSRGHGHTVPEPAEFVGVSNLIQKHSIICDASAAENLPSANDLLTSQIGAIARLHEKLIADASDLRLELSRDRSRMEQELEERAGRQESNLEARYADRAKLLDSREKELTDKAKTLDDRAYTYARRDDRARITEAINERLKAPGLSSSTLSQRRNVYRLLGLLSVVLLSAAVYTGYELSLFDSVSTIFWVTVVRLSVLTSVAVGVSIYAIQWARSNYFQDANAERTLERYSYDLNRASWAIETILEAKKENGEIPPETWIVGTCRNLFELDKRKDSDESAAEFFADLLKVAAKARVGTDGASLEFSNAGTNKIAKSIE